MSPYFMFMVYGLWMFQKSYFLSCSVQLSQRWKNCRLYVRALAVFILSSALFGMLYRRILISALSGAALQTDVVILLVLYLYFYLNLGMPPICINLWYYQSKNEFIVLIFEPKHSKTISFILKYAVLHNLDFADKNSKIPQFVFPFDPHLTNKELHWKLHYNYSKCVDRWFSYTILRLIFIPENVSIAKIKYIFEVLCEK